MSVADELMKLADLKGQGILTEEEFQQQKAIVLNQSKAPAPSPQQPTQAESEDPFLAELEVEEEVGRLQSRRNIRIILVTLVLFAIGGGTYYGLDTSGALEEEPDVQGMAALVFQRLKCKKGKRRDCLVYEPMLTRSCESAAGMKTEEEQVQACKMLYYLSKDGLGTLKKDRRRARKWGAALCRLGQGDSFCHEAGLKDTSLKDSGQGKTPGPAKKGVTQKWAGIQWELSAEVSRVFALEEVRCKKITSFLKCTFELRINGLWRGSDIQAAQYDSKGVHLGTDHLRWEKAAGPRARTSSLFDEGHNVSRIEVF